MNNRLRKPNDDKRKSMSKIQDQLDRKVLCETPGCQKPLSQMSGPGSDCLCRVCQLKLSEYEGGMGRRDRISTIHRKHFCENEKCGYNPYEDTTTEFYHLKKTNQILFERICRTQLIGDHNVVRKVDGNAETETDIKTLCLLCNAVKTIINEDYKPRLSVQSKT